MMETGERAKVVGRVMGRRHAMIYLTDWQMRMIKDFLGIDCHVWIITEDAEPVLRYGMFPDRSRDKRMYLTDWQMREVENELGFTCEFVDLCDEIIPLYMVKAEEARKLYRSQEDKAFFRIELDATQKRYFKELFGAECAAVDVPIFDPDIMKYRIPIDRQPESLSIKELVLNAEQQKALENQFGATCEAITIDTSIIAMYGVATGR